MDPKFVSLLFCCISLSCLVAIADPEQGLHGRWILDQENSDDIQDALKKFRKDNKSKRKKSRSNKKDATADTRSSRKGGVEALIADYLPEVYGLSITGIEQGILLQYEGQSTRAIDTSGLAASVSVAGKSADANRDVKIAGWEDGNLYSEITTQHGIRIYESYLLADSSQSLIIETEFLYPAMEPFKIKRRYNRVQSE
jgi:hypothetical protein